MMSPSTLPQMNAFVPYEGLPTISPSEEVTLAAALDRYLCLIHGRPSAIDAAVFTRVMERVAAEGACFDEHEAAVVIAAIADVPWGKARTFVYFEMAAIIAAGDTDFADPDAAILCAYHEVSVAVGGGRLAMAA